MCQALIFLETTVPSSIYQDFFDDCLKNNDNLIKIESQREGGRDGGREGGRGKRREKRRLFTRY